MRSPEAEAAPNPYQPVMRRRLTLSDEKKAAEGYTGAGSGVTEVESPWC